MKQLAALGLISTSLLLSGTEASRAVSVQESDLPPCFAGQLLGYLPDQAEIATHRQSSLPIISYPYGTSREEWGMQATIRVDESGRVVCHSPNGRYGRELELNDERRSALQSLRFVPFIRNGKPVPAIVVEQINEQELPQAVVSAPQVPLHDVRISLDRTGCYGTCPSYRVLIHGDGRVVYEGSAFVDVEGTHAYQVPVEEVAQLVESVREKELWSLRSSYVAGITDQPTYTLTIAMGDQVRTIADYAGELAGMPPAVTAFEKEVDKVARSAMWIHMSREAVVRLREEGFDFRSKAGAEVLARAAANSHSDDDEAIASLVQLGTAPSGDVLERALFNQRVALVEQLIAKGAFGPDGRRNQARIDAAFHAAIAGGRFELVQAMWEVRGSRRHPALTFDDVSEDPPVRKRSPVTLLLSHNSYQKTPWDGLKIAKWLALQGCDLKATAANGTTLLHIATEAGDAEFVRYLLDQGLDASTPGEFGLPALGSVEDEEVALILLEAGTDMSTLDDFARYAEDNHWLQVTEWLKARHR